MQTDMELLCLFCGLWYVVYAFSRLDHRTVLASPGAPRPMPWVELGNPSHICTE